MASSSHLKPGEKGSITVRLDTQNRGGFIVKTVEVVTNDPDRPRVVLTVKAEVKGKEQPAVPRQTPPTR
jgi:hypothetical protein